MFIKSSFLSIERWHTFLIKFIKVENYIKGFSNVKLLLHSWEKSILYILSLLHIIGFALIEFCLPFLQK